MKFDADPDVRLVAATSPDLEAEVAFGRRLAHYAGGKLGFVDVSANGNGKQV